ncbi:MAG: hypothetical protein VW124_17950 [Paracoccaceae bacterium]
MLFAGLDRLSNGGAGLLGGGAWALGLEPWWVGSAIPIHRN